MRKKYVIGVVVVVISMLVGIFIGVRPEPKGRTPDAATTQQKEVSTQGRVASASTTAPVATEASPPVKLVVSDGHQTKVITYPSHSLQPSSRPVPENPPAPGPKVPEEIIVNLSGPLEYTLQPGKRTPILTYELTDGAKHEWLPGVAAGWQDSTKSIGAQVWARVLEKQSSQPYVDSYVHFAIEASAHAKPGVHKVSVKLVLRPGIVLGVPVMVTVPEPPSVQASQGGSAT